MKQNLNFYMMIQNLDFVLTSNTKMDISINNINKKIAEIKSKSASLSKIENIEIENMDVSPIDSINKGSSLSSVDPSQIHYIKPRFNISQIPLPDSPIESKQKLNQLKISPPLFIPKKPLILKF